MSGMRILVPRWLDRDNHNAQNLNAKALLSRFISEDLSWIGAHYGEPDPAVRKNLRIELVQLWRRQLWPLRMWLLYLQPADALFYPGREAIDLAGVRWRKKLYPRRPIIATFEGLAGTEAREQQLSKWAGHTVYCQRVDQQTMDRVDAILGHADHVVALSPFLEKMGRRLYGDKFSVLPLGIDTSIFNPPAAKNAGRARVVSAGRVESHKRPELFLTMADKFPQADFIWYGEGSLRHALADEAAARKLGNVSFPGGLPPAALAEEFRRADLFIMPSKSEGVPKVTQEAAACGLPVILFGYYEAPSVIDGENGFVVWSDEALFSRLAELLGNPERLVTMGQNGTRLAKNWEWDVLAPQWERHLHELAGTVSGHAGN